MKPLKTCLDCNYYQTLCHKKDNGNIVRDYCMNYITLNIREVQQRFVADVLSNSENLENTLQRLEKVRCKI